MVVESKFLLHFPHSRLMAKKSIDLLAIPDKTEPNGVDSKRNSTGKPSLNGGYNSRPPYCRASIGSCNDRGNLRRNSTGEPSFPNSRQDILPHYLRASTGSCHDFCKYGKTHAFEVKARHPIPKRMTKPPSGRQNSVEVVTPADRKKAAVVKLKSSILSKAHSSESAEVIKREVFSPSRKVEEVTKHAPLSDAHLSMSPEIIKREVSSPSRKVEVVTEHSLNEVKITEKEKKMDLFAKGAPSVKPKPVRVKITQKEKKIDLSAKRAPSLKPKPVTVKPLSSSDTSGGLNVRRTSDVKQRKLTEKRNSDIKIGKNNGTPKAAVKKVLAARTVSLSPKVFVNRPINLNARNSRSPKLVSPLKDQNRIRKAKPEQPNVDNIQEKTLHVVKIEAENKILGSTQNDCTNQTLPSPLIPSPKSSSHPKSPSLSSYEEEDLEGSEYSDSEADYSISEDNETVSMDGIETLEGNGNKLPRKAGAVLSEDKDCAAMKLKFRRGKVVDLQSENNGPRRLRFRRGTVLGEHQGGKVDARRRTFKKRGVDGDGNGNNPGSEKVVLRHQDVQGKKDAQGLFNNVIEETASKLVESRKSKVKALVGAFETVISLQDIKPSAPIVS
ncbi:uncharacterized protein LOC132315958 isoform X2 [Cornus florida]|uniref:uncharacterized protein LOC132315958 isoform X2 n=1 Tax=Cornus florida TaxID=4283 RepID=UPI00289F6255|nr:uncharacterized protein LOC132315958 isoform X2 [Cornus florida]